MTSHQLQNSKLMSRLSTVRIGLIGCNMNIPSHVDVDEPSLPPTNKTDVDTNVQLSVVVQDELLTNVDASSEGFEHLHSVL